MDFIATAEGAPRPVGPYSAAVKAGNLVFCAGQIGLSPETGELIPGGIREQTKQVLQNLDCVLRRAGTAKDKIALVTIFLKEISDAKTVNEMYGDWIVPGAAPARQTLAVKDLPLGALVEISLIAAAAAE